MIADLIRYHRLMIAAMVLVILVSCARKDNQQNKLNMITTRTMGLAYLEEDKLPEAEVAFKELIGISPQEALGYANLGLVYIRMGKYQAAEENLRQALGYAPVDPEIQLNLAEVLIMTNREADAVNLMEHTLDHHPDHIRTLYKLGQIYAGTKDEKLNRRAEQLLIKVVNFLPANITARFDLIDLLLRRGKADSALSYLEQVEKQMPEFPDQANSFYQQCLKRLARGDAAGTLAPFNIFRNILKPTPLFRSGFDELRGMSGPLIGTPVISFRRDVRVSGITGANVLAAMRFTDASASAGLAVLPVLTDSLNKSKASLYIITLADFDGNGTQDLYAGGFDRQQGRNVRFLLRNDFGRFVDVTAVSGIDHGGEDHYALFTDYDNNGYLDLYIVNSLANVLYYHYEPEKFRNITTETGIGGHGSGLAACFADFDHDGDLDLYQANQGENRFYRNNLDGTFSENSEKMNIAGVSTPSNDAVFADFDDDGDLDLFVMNSVTSSLLYSNLRQGQFADITATSGLATDKGSRAVSLGDYNNDGWQDLVILPANADQIQLFKNIAGKNFSRDNRSEQMILSLKQYNCRDIRFFDFDNDGFLDLVVSGEPKEKTTGSRGVLLFHNDGNGVFSDASQLLPENIPYYGRIHLADYNEDGDLDLFVSGNDGRVHLLRNDGGNTNNYLKVQLVGLRTGSGKNNYFGIGAKVEVRAGDLYQSQTVAQPVIHFGLGQRDKADVVRVLWTNGVPQNLFEPGSNQSLLEKQILKGSCPFLYAWNGEKYEFVTDVLWRSALGMPLGIMGGETAYAFSDPSRDYYRISGDQLQEKNGYYSLQLTAELWETPYFDQVKLIAVDHPAETDIFVDEKFTPPPFPPFHIRTVKDKRTPVSAFDGAGNDILPLINYKDDLYVSDMNMDKYQGVTKAHDLIIDLGANPDDENVILYFNGWVFPTDASINVALSQSSELNVFPPYLQVKDSKGKWQTVIDNLSFPMGKNKYVIVDLSGKFLSSSRQVRIRTGMHILWDYMFYTAGNQQFALNTSEMALQAADLHYRGFSRMYRKGGRYGPFWFEYDDISTDPLWRDLVGSYTRYGDVRDLLLEQDSKYVITNAGDEITLTFAAASAFDLPQGWRRDFIIYTGGWLKDGDLNTASGQTVEPLPFIGMSKYPYGADEKYPQAAEYQEYQQKYNTRNISGDHFRGLLKDN